MLTQNHLAKKVDEDGFAIVEQVISSSRVEQLQSAIAAIPDGEEVRRKEGVYGVRNLIEVCSAVRDLAASSEVRSLVTPILGDACFAVRATFLIKLPTRIGICAGIKIVSLRFVNALRPQDTRHGLTKWE